MNNDKQLTPEEMGAAYAGALHKQRSFSYQNSYLGWLSGFKEGSQQTAARDEEIKKLKEKISGLLNDKLAPVVKEAEEFTALIEKIAEQNDRIAGLEGQLETANMCKDIANSDIVKKDKWIKELIISRDNWEEVALLWIAEADQRKKEGDERIKELVLAECIVKDTEFVKTNQKAAIDMRIERDQAFDLLEEFPNKDGRPNQDWNIKRLSLLSSRDNKKQNEQR